MIDWRELMPKDPSAVTPRKHPQYPQKGECVGGFEDIEDKTRASQRHNERQSHPDQWFSAWRELAQCTDGMTKYDPRYAKVMDALEQCDRAFETDRWPNFLQAAATVKTIMEARQG